MSFAIIILMLSLPLSSSRTFQQTVVTTKGCPCLTVCAANFSDCYYDDRCYANCSDGIDYGICDYSPRTNYESQSAQKKFDFIWNKILDTSDAAAPQLAREEKVVISTVTSLRSVFNNYHDEVAPDRNKIIHTRGASARVRFHLNPGLPFTGFFRGFTDKGGFYDLCMIRMSAAAPLPETNPKPGMAIKCFIDDQPSLNMVTMPNVEGLDSYDFFRFNFSTQYPLTYLDALEENTAERFAFKLFYLKLVQTSDCFHMTGLTEWSQWNHSEEADGPVVTPYGVTFVPTLPNIFPAGPPFSGEKMLDILEQNVPNGTTIFEVYSRLNPGDDFNIHVGSVEVTSPFTRSTYGDQRLQFRHQYMESDFAIHPEWRDMIADYRQECGVLDGKPPLGAYASKPFDEIPGCPFNPTLLYGGASENNTEDPTLAPTSLFAIRQENHQQLLPLLLLLGVSLSALQAPFGLL